MTKTTLRTHYLAHQGFWENQFMVEYSKYKKFSDLSTSCMDIVKHSIYRDYMKMSLTNFIQAYQELSAERREKVRGLTGFEGLYGEDSENKKEDDFYRTEFELKHEEGKLFALIVAEGKAHEIDITEYMNRGTQLDAWLNYKRG